MLLCRDRGPWCKHWNVSAQAASSLNTLGGVSLATEQLTEDERAQRLSQGIKSVFGDIGSASPGNRPRLHLDLNISYSMGGDDCWHIGEASCVVRARIWGAGSRFEILLALGTDHCRYRGKFESCIHREQRDRGCAVPDRPLGSAAFVSVLYCGSAGEWQ